MKKNLKSQLMAAVSMLVVAAVALTGATYAWFTAVANPEVQNMDLYVKAADSMLLSSMLRPNMNVAGNWSALLTMSDIEDGMAAINGTGNPFVRPEGDLVPMFPKELYNVSTNKLSQSTLGSAPNGLAGFRGIRYNDDGSFLSYTNRDITQFSNDAVTGNEYVQFELWAKSTNDGYVYIDANSFVKAYKHTIDTMSGERSVDETGVLDYVMTAPGEINEAATPTAAFLASTVRVAFVPINYPSDGDTHTLKTILDGGAHAFTDKEYDWSNAVIWEPNSDKHLPTTQGGEIPALSQNRKVTTQGVNGVSVANNDKTGVADQLTYDFLTDETNAKLTDDTAVNDKIVLFNLGADTMKNFAVFIWVEGADGDTVNAVAKNMFRTLLKFGQDSVTLPK